MTDLVDELFNTGLERYRAGEGPDTLIPVFKDICDRSPKIAAAWSCLAWLYMLDNRPEQAYKAAQKAVKIDGVDPQNRVNLVATLLETGKTGVREHLEAAKSVMAGNAELSSQIKENIDEGLTRKPDWDSLKRIQKWLFES